MNFLHLDVGRTFFPPVTNPPLFLTSSSLRRSFLKFLFTSAIRSPQVCDRGIDSQRYIYPNKVVLDRCLLIQSFHPCCVTLSKPGRSGFSIPPLPVQLSISPSRRSCGCIPRTFPLTLSARFSPLVCSLDQVSGTAFCYLTWATI